MEIILSDPEYRETGELREDSGLKGRETRAKSHRNYNIPTYIAGIPSKKRKI